MAAGVKPDLRQVDFRQLPVYFAERFDAVLCLNSSIAEMPSDEAAVEAFTSMHAVLCPGGVLVLSQGTSDRQWNERLRFSLAMIVRISPDCSSLTTSTPRIATRDTTYWTSAVKRMVLNSPRGTVTCTCCCGTTKSGSYWPPDSRLIDFFGSFSGEPYDRLASDRIVTVAYG